MNVHLVCDFNGLLLYDIDAVSKPHLGWPVQGTQEAWDSG